MTRVFTASPRGFSPALAVFVFLVLAFSTGSARAQVLYGTVLGTVTDGTGAVVPGADVTLTSRASSLARTTKTNETGLYQFPNVIAGDYSLRISATGFRSYTQDSVAVSVNSVQRVDATLQVGQISESVTVESSALRLQTDKADVHAEVNAREIVNLPLPRYRNYQSLLDLVPGATPGQFQNANTDTPARALTTNINGVNRNNNNTRIDGATDVYIWLPHHTVYVPPADTIDTVDISTNSFDAEQGMAGGAAITVVTKSGTNDLHGSAFGFHDNSKVGAKNFFFKDPKTPKSIVNIDGFTLGGPIMKNKLFFFGGWEGNRERVNRNRLYTVPDAAQRSGDFSAFGAAIYDPFSGNPDGTARSAFANSTVPLDRQSAMTRKLQDLIPLPNQTGDTANYFASATQAENRDNYDVKIDWNRKESHRIWGKYSAMDAQVSGAFGLGAAGGQCLCDGGAGTGNTLVQLATIGHTWTFSPTFFWDGTIGWTRMGQKVLGPDFGQNFGLDTLGIPGTNGADPRQSGMPIFNISGYSSLGNIDSWEPIFRNDQSYTTSQNFTMIHGSHDIRFGFDGVRHWLNHWQPEIGGGPRGQFDFNQEQTGLPGVATQQFNAWAAFLMGTPFDMQKSVQFEKMTAFEWQLGWYVRDRWQITPKLTATIGLRYELYPLMTRAGRGGIEGYDPATNIVTLGGLGGNPKDLGIGTSKKLFAPRIGLAYRLDNSTVIRTGYGITYDPLPLARPLRGFYPLTIAADFEAPASFQFVRPIEQGIPDIPLPDVSSGAIPLPPTVDMRFISGGKLKRGYVQSWNFIVERQLPAGFIGSVGYVGTQTVHQLADWDGNAAPVGGGSAGRPLYAPFGRTAITRYFNGFLSANYHSLQATINRRVGNMVVQGAYTYSRAINFTDDDGSAGLMFNTPSDLARNRAQAGYNIPHMFQLGMVYDLPFGPGKSYANSGPLRWVIGDWHVNGIFSAVQGRPFTVTASGGSLNAPGNSQTADQVTADVNKLGTVAAFYDPAAFAPVTDVRFGTSGRNSLRGPGVTNLDLSLFRDIPLKERLKLQFRAEAFNISNTPHFANPNADVNSANFMQITSTDANSTALARTIRFGLRLQW